jgi:hypothetical protein
VAVVPVEAQEIHQVTRAVTLDRRSVELPLGIEKKPIGP